MTATLGRAALLPDPRHNRGGQLITFSSVGYLMTILCRAHQRAIRSVIAARRDRGDVPGWVLITVMTAGLVSALWLIAGPALTTMFQDALAGVTGR